MSRCFALTAVEDGVIASERRSWPMNIHLEARLTHRLDRDRLKAAVATAMGHHPLAGSRQAPGGLLQRVRYWEHPDRPDIQPVIDDSRIDSLLSTPIPLHTAPLMRILLERGDGDDTVVLCAHHGAFDALGGIVVLRTIAAAYVGAPLPSADDDLDDRRVATPAGGVRPSAGLRRALWPPRSVRIRGRSGTGAAVGYGITQRRVNSITLAGLRSAAKAPTTVNDVLVAALHLTVDRWNGRHGAVSGPVSIVVPMSRRGPGPSTVVANRTGQMTVWSEAGQRSDPAELLAGVTAQTSEAKRNGARGDPSAILGAASWLPAAVRRAVPPAVCLLTGDRALATTRLSNLGVQDDAELQHDDFHVDTLWFSPPCRPPQGLVLGTVTFGGTLQVTARWCRSTFDAAAAAAFTGDFVEELERLAQPAAKPRIAQLRPN
ncbi:MAG TPA: hypothetical protein VLL25_10320 [Acidimicrobiales bacterium]|nr:hypothetical protein [Acidimicrobiales bacterium]